MSERRIIIYGNAGAGKTTMARELQRECDLPLLLLDSIAWSEVAVRRPLEESINDLEQLISGHSEWMLEGCYGELVEAALPHCTELRFLNPGVAACVENCRKRPWEPDKFPSPEEQDKMLADLISWVREYERREDEYGLARHRAIYDNFHGTKQEYS